MKKITSLLLATTVSILLLAVAHSVNAGDIPINNNTMVFSEWDNGVPGMNYSQNYQGNYAANWNFTGGNNNGGDFTIGAGWNAGINGVPPTFPWISIGYNAGQCEIHGFGQFGAYGWFVAQGSVWTDTEFYITDICDHSPLGNPTRGTWLGTVYADGDTYDVYHSYPVYNADGTQRYGINGHPLEQWVDVRRHNQSTGVNNTISTWIHFSNWQSLGWNMGQYYSMELGTEGGFGGYGQVNATAWWNH